MRKPDWEEAVIKYEPCALLGTVLKLITDKYEISRGDLYTLLELHKKKEFTWEDFGTAELTANWDKHRWYRMKNDSLVELYRAKDGKFKRYNIYRLTNKAKKMIREFYDILSGAKPLPTIAYSKNARYSSNRLVDKVNDLNNNDNG